MSNILSVASGYNIPLTASTTQWSNLYAASTTLPYVTSVSATVPTGLSISGSPITSAGTLAISLTSGYNIPLTASTTQWSNLYNASTTLPYVTSVAATSSTGLTFSGSPITSSGTLTLAGVLNSSSGGTGTTTAQANKLLIGNSSGTGWTEIATSSLGISGGGTPGGANSQIQYNLNGTFGATSTLTYSTTTNTLSIKAKSGQSSNTFQALDSGNTAQFYTDSNATANFANSPIFHNIAGGSLLGLTNSNVIQGISSLTNLSYNPSGSQLSAIPSGSNTDYQFNNSSAFAGTSHAVQNSDTSSTFLGSSNSPPTAGGYSGVTAYGTDAGAFTSGYPTDGSTKGYKLYTEKLNPIDSSSYYSPTPDVSALTDNNSSITLSPASGSFASGVTEGSGAYNNQTVYYSLLPTATYNGNLVSASSPTYANGSDFSGNPFTVNGITASSYAYPLGYSSVGFRMQRSLDNGSTYDSYKDVGDITATPVDDDGSGWTPLYVTSVSASENTMGSGYTEDGSTRDYQIYAQWTDPNTNSSVVSYLGTGSSAPAQAGFTDANTGQPYDGSVTWASFTFPANAIASTPTYIVVRQVNGGGFTQYVNAGNTTSLDDSGDGIWNSGGPGSFGATWNGVLTSSVKNFFQNNFSWSAVTGSSGFKMLYSPNNFASISTPAAPYLSNPTANFGASGYLNNTIDYQVWAWQTISGVKIYSGSSLYLSVADSSGNPFGVDIAFTAPAFSPYASATGYTLQRNIDGAGFLDYQDFSSTSFTDNASGWTSGTPVLTPVSGTYFVAKELGNVTSFTDTGSISYSDSLTTTPTSIGPFGATIGGTYGLSTTGPLNVNGEYNFSSLAPSATNQIQTSTGGAGTTMAWTTFDFAHIAGSASYSQLGLSGGLTGNILVNGGSSIGNAANTLDYGALYHTMRVPTVFGYESGIQVGPGATSPYWQEYSPSADLQFYNLHGSYGLWMTVSDSDRGVHITKLFYPDQETSAPSYVKGAIYFDTTLNKLRVGGAAGWETITSI